MIQIIRMSTPSNIGQELILHYIHSEVYRVEKKDALTHALAIGFSHSKFSANKVQATPLIANIHPKNTLTSQVSLKKSSFSDLCMSFRSKITNPRIKK